MAQTAPRTNSQRPSSTTTTTTTTTTQMTTTGPEHNIEGCMIKEGSDVFLVPERGNPFKLQSSQDLSAQEGHRVMVSGKEASLPAGAPMSNREIMVDNVKSIADTCPVNWNPVVKRR